MQQTNSSSTSPKHNDSLGHAAQRLAGWPLRYAHLLTAVKERRRDRIEGLLLGTPFCDDVLQELRGDASEATSEVQQPVGLMTWIPSPLQFRTKANEEINSKPTVFSHQLVQQEWMAWKQACAMKREHVIEQNRARLQQRPRLVIIRALSTPSTPLSWSSNIPFCAYTNRPPAICGVNIPCSIMGPSIEMLTYIPWHVRKETPASTTSVDPNDDPFSPAHFSRASLCSLDDEEKQCTIGSVIYGFGPHDGVMGALSRVLDMGIADLRSLCPDPSAVLHRPHTLNSNSINPDVMLQNYRALFCPLCFTFDCIRHARSSLDHAPPIPKACNVACPIIANDGKLSSSTSPSTFSLMKHIIRMFPSIEQGGQKSFTQSRCKLARFAFDGYQDEEPVKWIENNASRTFRIPVRGIGNAIIPEQQQQQQQQQQPPPSTRPQDALFPCHHHGPCTLEIGCPCAIPRVSNADETLVVGCKDDCGCDESCDLRPKPCDCRTCDRNGNECPCITRHSICSHCSCACGGGPKDKCENRLFGTSKWDYQVQETVMGVSSINGWGAFASNAIPKDVPILEYVGEIISSEDADLRGRVADLQGMSVFNFELNSYQVLDARRFGCNGKWLNHAPKHKANCVAKRYVVDGETKVIIFSKRDIAKGEELTFEYRLAGGRDMGMETIDV